MRPSGPGSVKGRVVREPIASERPPLRTGDLVTTIDDTKTRRRLVAIDASRYILLDSAYHARIRRWDARAPAVRIAALAEGPPASLTLRFDAPDAEAARAEAALWEPDLALAGYLPAASAWNDGALTVTYLPTPGVPDAATGAYEAEARSRAFSEGVRPGDRVVTAASWKPARVVATTADAVLCRVRGLPSIVAWTDVYWPVAERHGKPPRRRVRFTYCEGTEEAALEASRRDAPLLRRFGLRLVETTWGDPVTHVADVSAVAALLLVGMQYWLWRRKRRLVVAYVRADDPAASGDAALDPAPTAASASHAAR